jgi:hypothetical protein
LVLDGGEWLISHPSYFILRDGAPVPIEEKARWIPEPDWMLLKKITSARNQMLNLK